MLCEGIGKSSIQKPFITFIKMQQAIKAIAVSVSTTDPAGTSFLKPPEVPSRMKVSETGLP